MNCGIRERFEADVKPSVVKFCKTFVYISVRNPQPDPELPTGNAIFMLYPDGYNGYRGLQIILSNPGLLRLLGVS